MSSSTPHGDARVVAENLTYVLPGGRALFRDLTLSFARERTGLIGPNGSGKTTLVRLLTGELDPTTGAVHRRAAVALLPQDFRPAPDAPLARLLGIEARLAALARVEAGKGSLADLDLVGDDGWDLPTRTAVALERFGLGHLSLGRPLHTLSGGEGTRTALAALALGRPDFLVLDEPTNHLDAASREALYAFVEGWSGGLLVVSHDRALLARMDRIVELSGLGVRVYGGNWHHYEAVRAAEDGAAERELESAKAALRRSERRAREVRERQARRDAGGRRRAAEANMPKILLGARKRQAQATTARVDATAEREVAERRARAEAARRRVEEREPPRFDLPSTRLPAGRTVLHLEEVTVRYPGAPLPVLHGVSLHMRGPERVALIGPNGCGKTTLLRIATGELTPDTGVVRRLPSPEVATLDQHGARLDPALSVSQNHRRFHPEQDVTAARYALARFLFAGESAFQSVGTLSGGERLRASLACLLGGERPPSLLVLDEPTNHLDLDALEALESALVSYDGALLVVSHDATFLEAIGVERWVDLGEPLSGGAAGARRSSSARARPGSRAASGAATTGRTPPP